MTSFAGFVHWAAIIAILLLATAFVSLIDPNPGTNWALNANVTVSSNDGTLASAKGAVDGDIWNVGFRTEFEENPWVMIDLGSEKRVSRIRIYNCYDRYPYPAIRPQLETSRDAWEANRRFGCRQEDEIPLEIEFSRDGLHFHVVLRQTERFELWVAKLLPQPVRYIRVNLLRVSHLQLREIEVY